MKFFLKSIFTIFRLTRKKFFKILNIIGIFIFFNIPSVLGYYIENLPATPVMNDIVLGPGKTELWLDPGAKTTKELMITNRTGKTKKFKIEIEDFTGSRDPSVPLILLGEERGPYSLKDFLKLEINEFVLEHGQRMVLPVEILIPEDAEPGGRYGSVLIRTVPMLTEEEIEKEKAKGQIALVNRLGTLFYIRIKGDIKEEGFLKDFKLKDNKKFYEKPLISFQFYFENNGNVHLTPYGIIEIKNFLGKKIDEIELQPGFVLPDSLRLREVKWEKRFLLGRYTAFAFINRGYKDIKTREDIIDQKYLIFWIIPWKIIIGGIIVLFLIIWGFYWITTNFEFRRKI